MDRRRVIEVLGERSGSGLLLADRLVLTAAHLLFRGGRVLADERAAGDVMVRLAGGGDRHAARCVWARYEGPDRGLDAALLEITSPGWTSVAVAGVRLGRLAGSAEARVHAFGFPDAAVRAGVAELSPVTGTVHTDSGAQLGRPEIVVDGEPGRGPEGVSLWAGLSGGPVFGAPGGVAGDVLLGVVAGDPAEFVSRRLRMIPTPAILADSAAAVIAERHCGSLAVISFPEPGPSRPPAPPGVRFSLPPDTAAFTGRGGELDRITTAVASAAEARGVVAVGAIDGMPGVGKTALAVRVAHVLSDRFPDRQLFIDLHAHTPGWEPLAAEDALAGLLAAAGVDPKFVPGDLHGRAAMWRDRMAGQRALLVLDNAASSSQVAPLLPGGGSCLVLVTSRRHLGDLPGAVVPVLLDVLPPERAEEMFIRLAPRSAADPFGVAEVVRLAGFLPLATSLLARVYARHPSWTLADLAAETRAGLLTLKAENNSIAAAFEVSYWHLDPAPQRFFRLLALHPGTTADSYSAAALAGISPGEAAGLLDILHGEGLLTETGHRRYGMHDLLRRYARDHAADREQALGRLLDYYQHTAGLARDRLARHALPGSAPAVPAVAPAAPALEDEGQALAWVRAERDSLLACLDHATSAGQHERVIALTAALAELLRRDGPWTEAITRHAIALQSAQHLGDGLGQASAVTSLGDLRRLTGDYPAAAADLEQALAIYRDLGDRLGEANALTFLGVARRETGDHRGAAAVLEQALAIYRDLGDRLGEPNALTYLGTVRRETGDYAAAAADLEQALAIYRDLGNRLGQANALTFLGDLRRETGDYAAAAADLEQALAIYRDLGNRLGQANALTFLGPVRRETGDYPRAAADFEQALAIYRDVGYRDGEVTTINEIGTLHRLSDEPAEAEVCHQKALELARTISSAWDEAHALAGLGRCAVAAGHDARAEALLRQAHEVFQRIGAADALAVLTELNALTGPGSGE